MPLGASRLSYLALPQAVEAPPAGLAQRQTTVLFAIGNAQVDTAISKFGGASGLFDGTGDAVNTDQPLMPATDDWTVEMWVYPTSIGAVDYFFSQYSAGSSGRTTMYMNGSGQVGLFINGGPSFTSTGTLSASTWQHIAWVRNGTSFKIYIDGVEDGSGTGSPSIQQTKNSVIGAQDDTGANGFIGNIDEVRVSDTARYTAGFTPSTTAFDNDENTLLLTHMNGTDGSTNFVDDTGNRTRIGVSAINGAQVDTAQSKFGGSSAYFDGTDDALWTTDYEVDYSSDFTIEAWVRSNNQSGFGMIAGDWGNTASNRGIFIGLNSSEVPVIYWSDGSSTNSITSSGGSIGTSAFAHIAAVRSSGTLTLYVDGTSVGSSSATINNNHTYRFAIGGDGDLEDEFLGWIDELRVSNTARYTGSFTPSSTPFINDSNTLLLLHMDGENGSADFVDDNQNIAESTGFAIDATGVTGYDLWWPQSAMHGNGSDSNVTFALLNVDTSGRATHSVLASTYDFSGENISSTTQSGTFLNPVSRGGEIATNGDADGVVCGRDNASDNAKLVGYTISNFGTTSSSTAPTISTPSSATTFDDNNGEWTTTVAYSNGYWVAGNNNNSNRQAVQMFTSSGGGAPSSYNTQYTSATIALNEQGESVGFNNGLSANNSLLFLHDRDSVNFKFAIYTANSSGTSELVVTGPSINTSRDRIGKCKDASNDWRAIKMARDAADGYMYVAGANCTAFGTPGSVNPTVSTSTNKTLVYPGTLNNSNIVQGQFDGESFLVYETGGVIYCRRLFYAGGTADVQVGEIITLGEHGLSAGYMTAVSYTHTDNTFVICGGVRDNTGAKVHPFGARI